MTDPELVNTLNELRDTMVSVSTGGFKIGDVNSQFRKTYQLVTAELQRRGITNPLPFSDLWAWHGRWSNGSMPSYKDRREFLSTAFEALIETINSGPPVHFDPTGWERVDQIIPELRDRLKTATTEEQFQSVGLLCREAIITRGHVIYDADRHLSDGNDVPSLNDAKKRLDAFLDVDLSGASNQYPRKIVKAAFDLSLQLQHKRTAAFRDAAICVEASIAVINIVAIVSGRRESTANKTF